MCRPAIIVLLRSDLFLVNAFMLCHTSSNIIGLRFSILNYKTTIQVMSVEVTGHPCHPMFLLHYLRQTSNRGHYRTTEQRPEIPGNNLADITSYNDPSSSTFALYS